MGAPVLIAPNYSDHAGCEKAVTDFFVGRPDQA
jgi:hypothetical protein